MRDAIERRWRNAQRAKNNRRLQDLILQQCAADPVTFIDDWCWTFDPRIKRSPHLPFNLWPKQVEFVHWLDRLYEGSVEGLCEKSRDSGMTWLCAAWMVHGWLFRDGFTGLFGANKALKVDKLGNLDSILEKVRFIITWLPAWMKPAGWNPRKHALYMTIKNPANGNLISGEAGDNIGRGGRSSICMIDEAAHLLRPQLVNASTSATTDVRVLISSVNGFVNWFAEQRFSGDISVFTFEWRDDPRKTKEWAAAKKRAVGSVVWAQEYDLDYGASMKGAVIKKAWVDAAKALHGMLPHPQHMHRPAGMDVGAGKDKTIFQPRIGELILRGEDLDDPDSINAANWAVNLGRIHKTSFLIYDPVGVGHGVKSAFARVEDMPFPVYPLNWGCPASTWRRMPDGRTAKETFANMAAELYWVVRERFRRSHEHLLFLEGMEGGVEHPQEDIVLLEPNPELEAELITREWESTAEGKIKLKSKQEMVKSPDWADALALSYYEPPVVDYASQAVVAGPLTQMDF